MNTTDFLRAVLPSAGLYVIGRLINGKFRHTVCDSIEEAAMYAQQYDAQGVATYMACAAYREREVVDIRPNSEEWRRVRVHRNVRAMRSFWMDLDVEPGNDKKYPTQEHAIDGLLKFCNATGLPLPMVVSSGGGIHVYWRLDNDILPEQWQPVADGLKQLSASLAFKTDAACTSDSARVLRPVGTANRKDASAPRWVELIQDAPPVLFQDFAKLVQVHCHSRGIKTAEPVRRVVAATETINAAFAVQQSFPPCSGQKVAERCAQLRVMRDTRGDMPEPHWYAGIQLLCHSTEGDALIHEWSKGYAKYSADETQRKITQVRDQHLGPTLCSTFAGRNPGGCDGCPFQGKISSPAQLGTEIKSAPAPVVTTVVAGSNVEIRLPVPPVPFTRGEAGGIYVTEDEIQHKIYEYDFFPTEIAYDEQLGYETTRWRHWLPREGWSEFTLQSSLLARPIEFEAKLRDNSIQPLIRNKMAMYGDAYLRKLRTDTKRRELFRSQGWKNDDTAFVLGDKLYSPDGVTEAGFSQGTQRFLAPFHSKGELAIWRAMTSIFAHPGFEAHAFILLCAFACPLLKLSGRQGFTVSMLGKTGIGKSTMAKFMSSVYSHPDQAWCKREDTKLARMQRFGAHFALPVYMDESTTIPNKELRDLIYEVPVGKGRDSMKRDYSLREGAEWHTMFVTSTNDSLQSKLQMEKANPEAESMRLFEIRFPNIPEFGPISKILPDVMAENYGVAGAEYIRQLVANRDVVRERLRTVVEETEVAFKMSGKERFWSQAIALALYGGELAQQWGIIDFNPNCIRQWLLRETQRMRGTIQENVVNSVTVLGDYLNEHVGERLTVSRLNAGMLAQSSRPGRELSQRYEKDAQMLYVPRAHVRRWLDSKFFNYSEAKDELSELGVLLSADTRKMLGAGTDMTGAQVPCWKIRADHPALSPILTEGEQ